MYQLNNKIISLINKINTYKWLLIPIIPSLLFIFLLVYLFMPQETTPKLKEEEIQITSTPNRYQEQVEKPEKNQQVIIEPHTTDSNESGFVHSEVFPDDDYYGDYDPSGLQNVQNVENLNNGTQRYTARSSNPTRSNIIIARNNMTIYQRSIPSTGADIPLQNIIDIFGQPERIIEGPTYYGSAVSEYIYAQKGVAVVVNNQTNQIVEHHFFQPTSVDSYIQNFGNDGLPLSN